MLRITKAVVDRLEQLVASPGRMNTQLYLFIRLSPQPNETNYLTEQGRFLKGNTLLLSSTYIACPPWLVVDWLT